MLNDNQAKKGKLLQVIILIAIVIMIIPVAIGALVSGVWFLGLPLALASVLLLWSIYSNFREYRQELPSVPKASAGNQPHSPGEITPELTVLGEWTVDTSTWKRFMKAERSLRNTDSIYMFIGALLLGIFALRNANIFIAIALTVVIGLIIVIGRRYFALKNLRVRTPCKVVITPTLVFLNEQSYAITDANRYLKKVQMIEKDQLRIIEFTIGWVTRNGPTFDELRIPVTTDTFAQAENVLNYFNKTH